MTTYFRSEGGRGDFYSSILYSFLVSSLVTRPIKYRILKVYRDDDYFHVVWLDESKTVIPARDWLKPAMVARLALDMPNIPMEN